MKVVLSRIFSRANLRIEPGYRMRPVLHPITIAPSAGMPVAMDRRPV
jgi:hypothetical protein